MLDAHRNDLAHAANAVDFLRDQADWMRQADHAPTALRAMERDAQADAIERLMGRPVRRRASLWQTLRAYLAHRSQVRA